jgi:geranylgeranyl diphosphate synthase type I
MMLPAIEEEIFAFVSTTKDGITDELFQMLAYHLGWQCSGSESHARGKRIRPLLLLLTIAGFGGEWRKTLPAAAAIELVHNFSLIHDDIQDNSVLRRGRPTLWKIKGVAQAINAGDAMYTLAYTAMTDLQKYVSPATALKATAVMTRTCLALAQGQYLDLAHEKQEALSMESYWYMVKNKTASMLAACTELGAVLAEKDKSVQVDCRKLGELMGLAFQAKDDFMGIWGNETQTGKSISSDLVSGKKSLPIIYALTAEGEFVSHWNNGRFDSKDIAFLIDLLEVEGAREYTQGTIEKLTEQAFIKLEGIHIDPEIKQALSELTFRLLQRES